LKESFSEMMNKSKSLRTRITRIIGIFVAVPLVMIGGCLSVDLMMLAKARPPKNLKTLEDFKAWKGDAIMGNGTYESSGITYTVMLAPAGRTLPSGPSAYLFNQKGEFVDWTSDMGDFSTVKHRFNLTGGIVKNIERIKK
jgi:hypothetical protein